MRLVRHRLQAASGGGCRRSKLVSLCHSLLVALLDNLVSLFLQEVVSSFFRIQLLHEHLFVLLLEALASLEVDLLDLFTFLILCLL